MAFRNLFLALTFTVTLFAGLTQAVPQLNGTYWNSNWDVMYFERQGNTVSSEYIYDNGVITGTLHGDTLAGWWREYNNEQACGPDGKWSGRILFLFDSSGAKFTGDWDYCNQVQTYVLNPNSTDRWTGTKRDSAYNEADCGQAGWHWCTDKCQIQPCGEVITKAECELAGRFWCTDACSLAQCPAAIKPWFARARTTGNRMPMSLAFPVDIRGRSLETRGNPAAVYFIGR